MKELDNLVRIGKLKAEPPARSEYLGLLDTAEKRLADARNGKISDESKFYLAYSAAHGYALAALRRLGYRSNDRITVFQTVVHTTKLDPAVGRILSKAHAQRNLTDYEGNSEIDKQLLEDLLRCAIELEAAVKGLAAPD